jgi:BirA family biotin operon repressor/biotin-[acetyl-CoA-carboxylase] ligase
VVRPRSILQSSLLPLLTGLALARALEKDRAAGGLRCGLKWPNDVWVGQGKVAGILCETAGEAVVVGVGVNLREPPGGFAEPHAPRARALEAVTGASWTPGRVLGALLLELRTLCDPPVLRFDGVVAREWKERDILLDQVVRVGAVEGRVRGVDPTGSLVVEDRHGTRTPVRAGHVEWPIDP